MTIFPTIHLNGTSAGELIAEIENATGAINLACDALAKTAPNMRDYPDYKGFISARDALQADLTAMHNILHRLQAVWENINDQVDSRNAQRSSRR